MTRNFVTTEIRGIRYGSDFDGRNGIEDIDKATIQRICIDHSDYIYNWTIYYNGQRPGVKNGGSGGAVSEITLEEGEYITIVKGRSDPSATTIGHLSFVSNKGRSWGPFGANSSGEPFTWNGESTLSPETASHMGLLYFSGSYGTSMAHLQATFAFHPGIAQPNSAIKYEEQIKSEADSEVSIVLSKFARNLMSPLVTLNVGKDNIIFRTYEDILCRLPFFRAALKGEFKESSDKIIRMPDDEPDTVSALIEYLYVGSYTYTYDPAKTTISKDKTPARDMSEGLFHIRLYTVAAKYDCQPLADAARKGLAYVMEELDSLDVVSLLMEMYDKGWVLEDWEDDLDMRKVKQGLPQLLKRLYGAQREEIEYLLADCPTLAIDLVRVLAMS